MFHMILILFFWSLNCLSSDLDSDDKTLQLVLDKSRTRKVVLEEFSIHGPMEIHDTALDTYMKLRRENPSATFDDESPLRKSIDEYAIKRNSMKPVSEISLLVSSHFHSQIQEFP